MKPINQTILQCGFLTVVRPLPVDIFNEHLKSQRLGPAVLRLLRLFIPQIRSPSHMPRLHPRPRERDGNTLATTPQMAVYCRFDLFIFFETVIPILSYFSFGNYTFKSVRLFVYKKMKFIGFFDGKKQP